MVGICPLKGLPASLVHAVLNAEAVLRKFKRMQTLLLGQAACLGAISQGLTTDYPETKKKEKKKKEKKGASQATRMLMQTCCLGRDARRCCRPVKHQTRACQQRWIRLQQCPRKGAAGAVGLPCC